MVTYLSRVAWDARPAKPGPGELIASWVTGVVIHWPGTTSRIPIRTQAAVAAALRSWQSYHMDDKGWSDIAYQVAVDQAGRAWMLRGFRTQSGANGNEALNKRYGAILLVLVQGEEPSTAMKATVRELVGHFRKIYPGATAVLPHGAVRPDGTDCPGPAASAALGRGDFTPGASTPSPTTPKDWFDMATPAEIEAAVKAGVLGALREYGSALFKDEQGTADTLVDEARAHRTAELAALVKIADAVSKS